MKDSILIERFTLSNALAYKAIRLQAVQNEPTAFGGSYEEEVLLPDSHYHQKFQEVWSTRDSAVFGAFLKDGRPVGSVGLFAQSGRKRAHKAYLWGMYVAPEMRQQGVGRKLVQTALGFAKSAGVQAVDLTVVTHNGSAIHLYKSFGFQVWGTEPSALIVNGQSYDEHHMTLVLPS